MTVGDGLERLQTAFGFAEEQWQRGEFPAALETLTNVLVDMLATSTAGSPSTVVRFRARYLVILEYVAELSVMCGKLGAADRTLQAMEALTLAVGNHVFWIFVRLNRVNLARIAERLGESERLLRGLEPEIGSLDTIPFTPEGLASWEAWLWPAVDNDNRGLLLSRLYYALGMQLLSGGQYERALCALQRGMALSGGGADEGAQAARIHLQLAIATAFIGRGDLELARARLAELEPQLEPDWRVAQRVRWLHLSGKLHLLAGELEPAIERFREIRKLCVGHGFGASLVSATLDLAQILTSMNQTAAAHDLLDSVGDLVSGLEDAEARAWAAQLHELAKIRAASFVDDVSITLPVAAMRNPQQETRQTTIEIGEFRNPPPSPNFLSFFEDRSLGFSWDLGRGQLGRAERRLRDLQNLFGVSDSALIAARLRALAGTLAYYQARYDVATVELSAARATFHTLGIVADQWQIERLLAWCSIALGYPLEQQQDLARSSKELLDRMAQPLSPAARAVFLLNKWTNDEEYIAGAVRDVINQQQVATTGSVWLRPFRTWRAMHSLHQLLLHIDRYKGDQTARTLASRELETARLRDPTLVSRLLFHPRERATLSFVVLPDSVVTVRTRWCGLDLRVNSVSRIELRDMVRRWHRAANGRAMWAGRGVLGSPDAPREQAMTRAESETRRIGGQLAARIGLTEMLCDLPTRVSALTIVPDDSLHGFPFVAVPLGGGLLIERYALSTSFDHRHRSASSALRGQALLVGVSRGTSMLRALPGVCAELDAVGATWDGAFQTVRSLVNEDATRDRVLAELAHSVIVHAACHGLFETDKPDASGMVLVPEPDWPEVLTLRELATQDLSHLQHTTLSACWSADSFVVPGRWIVSLPEVLWRAGARSVLGSLWEVDDQHATAIMAGFYSYSKRMARDQALRQVQLDCLNGRLGDGSANARSPLTWAAFGLYGDYRRLRFQQAHTTSH